MECWPADFRADASSSSKKKRRGTEVSRLNGQSIEPGSLGAATLILGEALPQWITAVQPNSRYLPRLVGKPVEVFPPTKPPPITIPKLTIHRRAEQGARFLRTYHPDVDIPFDLIKDELQLDEKQTAVYSVLDPYAGNRLVYFSMETKRKQLTHFLAFPCGVTGSELNVSPFRLTGDRRYIFSPSATPTLAFDTPIQQIVTLSAEADPQKTSLLGVRTHAVVSVLKLQSSTRSHIGDPPIVAEVVIPISLSETGNRRIVDMSSRPSSTSAQLLLVNELGVVYNCQIKSGGKALSSPLSMPVSDDDGLDRFWRLAWKDTHSCMRASSKKVHLFDLRSPPTQSDELFCLRNNREYLTSLEAPSDSRHAICFATTSKVLWYDGRNSKRPVLSIMHQRCFDRSLRLDSIQLPSSTITTLSSASNHIVTVYDVNYASSGHFEVHGPPSLLPGSSVLDLPVLGSLVFQPKDEDDQTYHHFQLSARGSLWRTNFKFSSDAAADFSDDHPDDFEWSDEMVALGKKGRTITQDIGNLGGREYIIADLRGIYEKMYNVQRDVSQVSGEDAEAVYQTIEKMPFFWQDMSATAEHMLTTFDVAFQSGSEPAHVSRADFLTESLLSTTRGFVAVIRGRIPIPRLIWTAPWSYDLGALPPALVPNMTTPSETLFHMLKDEALAQAVTPQGMQRATEATQSLVLDLALSRHVYAPQSFSKTRIDASEQVDGADILSRATKALSLGATEPPPLQFGFLRPMAKAIHKNDEGMESASDPHGDEKLEISWGVRLLLSHWDVGSSPDDYLYKDPYVGEDPSITGEIPATDRKNTRDMVGSTVQASIPTIVTAALRPPTVISSLPQQIYHSQSRPHSQTASSIFENQVISGTFPASQPPFSENDVSCRQTQRSEPHIIPQDLPGPSTQPLPGPFGGGNRQLGTRKKVGKKRMGGF